MAISNFKPSIDDLEKNVMTEEAWESSAVAPYTPERVVDVVVGSPSEENPEALKEEAEMDPEKIASMKKEVCSEVLGDEAAINEMSPEEIDNLYKSIMASYNTINEKAAAVYNHTKSLGRELSEKVLMNCLGIHKDEASDIYEDLKEYVR